MRGADLQDVTGAHIVFCSMTGSTVHLDCISTSEAARWWPFTLVVEVPAGADWASVAARTLGRWSAESVALELRVESTRTPNRIRISDGTNALRLDLVDVSLQAIA